MKTVLFVCVHNAGRSQMAEAFANRLATERGMPVRALSAGTVAGSAINPAAIAVMSEIGIAMESQHPKQLTQEIADGADDRTRSQASGVVAAYTQFHLDRGLRSLQHVDRRVTS